MTSVEQLERDLAAWFAETAAPGAREAAEDVLLETRGTRQRRRWTFLPFLRRPMDPPLFGWASGAASWRRVALVVVILGLVLLAAAAVFVGGPRPLPAPFGAAANGLVAYEKAGDIFVVDPATAERRLLVGGPAIDRFPRWSLDGTRLAFVRGPDESQDLVIVDASGGVRLVSKAHLVRTDPDGIAWAPDGRSIVVIGESGLQLIDTRSGEASRPVVGHWGLEAHWRPPDGRELLFIGGPTAHPALFLYSLASGAATQVPGTTVDVVDGMSDPIRPVGWTPDGRRFVYHRATDRAGGHETVVVDVESGREVVLDLAYGRISNDGTRVVGVATDGDAEWLCVAPVDGGPCRRIDGSTGYVDRTGFASWQWAPDDTAIRSWRGAEGSAVLLDPNGGPPQSPDWVAEGLESWQRRAH